MQYCENIVRSNESTVPQVLSFHKETAMPFSQEVTSHSIKIRNSTSLATQSMNNWKQISSKRPQFIIHKILQALPGRGLIMTISGEDIHLLFDSFLAIYKTKSTSSRSSFLQQTTAVYFTCSKLFREILQTDDRITKESKQRLGQRHISANLLMYIGYIYQNGAPTATVTLQN